MRWLACALSAALAVAASPPLLAQDRTAEAGQQVRDLQSKEARLFAIGWGLATGNAEFCDGAAPAAGILLHDAYSYANPSAVLRALELDGPIGVQAVADGSPAEAAGLKSNMTLTAVERRELANWPFDENAGWRRMAEITTFIEERLRQRGAVLMHFQQAGDPEEREALVEGVPACPTRFELLPGSDRVVADGSRVLLGSRFSGFAYGDELLAAAVAHELAHNLLRHRERLDRTGRSNSNVRATEREADRLMPWLLANAGYRPETAVEFMQAWGPRSRSGALGGIFRARSHDGWDERAELIAAELPLVRQAMAGTGKADWRGRFAVSED